MIEAAKQGFNATGIELNLWLVWFSKLSAFKHGVSKNTHFRRKDIWKVSVTSPCQCPFPRASKYSIVLVMTTHSVDSFCPSKCLSARYPELVGGEFVYKSKDSLLIDSMHFELFKRKPESKGFSHLFLQNNEATGTLSLSTIHQMSCFVTLQADLSGYSNIVIFGVDQMVRNLGIFGEKSLPCSYMINAEHD